MERLRIDGADGVDVAYAYERRGEGTPVVFLHASPFVEWYDPLIEQLSELSILRYHRYLADRPGDPFAPFSVADDARLCARLMDHLDIERAHTVGHSYGALVALQLALDAPNRVQSLALLEPAASGVLPAEQARVQVTPIIEAYQAGDTERAVDLFLQMVCGHDYRDTLDEVVPGGFDTAVARADVFFRVEMPALRGWELGPDEARRITQPVLNVRGTRSVPRCVAASDLVASWFPAAETFVLADAGHFLMVEQPKAMALGLVGFIGRDRSSTT